MKKTLSMLCVAVSCFGSAFAYLVVDKTTTPWTYREIPDPVPASWGRAASNIVNEAISTVTNGVATKEYVDQFAANHATPVVTDGSIPWSNNPVSATLTNGAVLSCAGSWPYSKPVFVKVSPVGTYSPAANLRLVGYGTWPTSPFQAVAWYSNAEYFFNVLVVEE